MKKIMKKVLVGTFLSLMLFTVAGNITAYAGDDNAYTQPDDTGGSTRNDTNKNSHAEPEDTKNPRNDTSQNGRTNMCDTDPDGALDGAIQALKDLLP